MFVRLVRTYMYCTRLAKRILEPVVYSNYQVQENFNVLVRSGKHVPDTLDGRNGQHRLNVTVVQYLEPYLQASWRVFVQLELIILPFFERTVGIDKRTKDFGVVGKDFALDFELVDLGRHRDLLAVSARG